MSVPANLSYFKFPPFTFQSAQKGRFCCALFFFRGHAPFQQRDSICPYCLLNTKQSSIL